MKSIITFSLCLLSWATTFAQTTVTFTPSKDNTLFELSNTASNGAGSSIFAGNDNNGPKRRALMRFNLSSIPANATINNVTLRLSVNKTIDGTARTHKLQKASADWGEGTSSGLGGGAPATTNDATWTDRFFGVSTWSIVGGDFSATVSGSTSIGNVGAYTFPSTTQLVADVQAWVNSASTNFGWVLIGDESTTRTARGFDSREAATIANRPTLSVTYTAVVPVELIDFTAYTEGGKNKLTWATASEFNNKGFDIKRKQGDNWATIGFVAANPQPPKGAFRNYTFLDIAPPSGAGGVYYRLRQIDHDGTETLSKVVAVTNKGSNELKVYPSVTHQFLTIETASTEPFHIINLLGQEVITHARSGRFQTSPTLIDVSALQQGTYILKIGSEQVKFVKQ